MNSKIIWLFATIFLIWSCSKNSNDPDRNAYQSVSLDNLNNYTPIDKELSDVYHSFRIEVESSKDLEYKSTIEPIDRPIDEAIWLLEASLNRNWGFTSDSIEELIIDTTFILLNNKNVGSNGIPIIDGNEIVSKYMEFELNIVENEEAGILFWATHLEIREINADKTIVEMIVAGGTESETLDRPIIPKYPGTELDEFPSNYSNYAGTPASSMGYLEYDLWDEIRAPGYYQLDPEYVATWSNTILRSAYDGYSNILWDYGTCQSYVVNSSVANQLLLDYKDYIDEENPINNPDYFIGYFKMNCWNYDENYPNPAGGSGVQWFQHAITIDIYHLEYVGLPE